MAQLRSKPHLVICPINSWICMSCLPKSHSTSTLALLGRRCGLGIHVDLLRLWYDRVSRVPDLPDRSSCKVRATQLRSNLVLDNRIAERQWLVSMHMASRFRARNSMDMNVTMSAPSICLPVAHAENEKPVHYSQSMTWS